MARLFISQPERCRPQAAFFITTVDWTRRIGGQARPGQIEEYLRKVWILMQQSTPSASSSSSPGQKDRNRKSPILQSPKSDVQMAVNPLQVIPEQDGISPIHLLCFDRDFTEQADTEAWSFEVQRSLREKFDDHELRTKKSDGIKFILCVGTFKTQARSRTTTRSTLPDNEDPRRLLKLSPSLSVRSNHLLSR